MIGLMTLLHYIEPETLQTLKLLSYIGQILSTTTMDLHDLNVREAFRVIFGPWQLPIIKLQAHKTRSQTIF